MTRSRRFFAALAMAALPTNFAVAAAWPIPQSTTAIEGEPFRSFRLLDAELTLLSNQQTALKAGLGEMGSPDSGRASGSVTAILTHMNSTTSGIERIAGRLERLYQTRHESFGVRIFRILRSRAQAVQHDVSSVRRARTQSDAGLAERKLDEHLVSLIIQFQAASGGYAATHCPPRARICCQPKRSKDLLPGEQVACKWVCVSSAQTCRGILGPRIPQASVESRRQIRSK